MRRQPTGEEYGSLTICKFRNPDLGPIRNIRWDVYPTGSRSRHHRLFVLCTACHRHRPAASRWSQLWSVIGHSARDSIVVQSTSRCTILDSLVKFRDLEPRWALVKYPMNPINPRHIIPRSFQFLQLVTRYVWIFQRHCFTPLPW